MTRLLINNTEQNQPYRSDGTQIVLYGRTAENPAERVEITVTGFEPYFYGAESEVRENESWLLGQSVVSEIQYGEFEALTGTALARIYTHKPQQVPEAKELLEESWAADVPFTNRFRIDTGIRAYVEIPDDIIEDGAAAVHVSELNPVQPDEGRSNPGGNGVGTALQNTTQRVVTLDIEVDDRADGFPRHGHERILSIVAYDSYNDETVAFVDTNGRSEEQVAEMCGLDAMPDDRSGLGLNDVLDEIRIEPSEKRMLISFRSWFTEKDPDLITGWNVDDFDMKYIIERMERVEGADPNTLSPLGWSGVTSRGEPRVKGRTIYDLLDVYKANSFTELDSHTLDDVAKAELDEEKLAFDGSFYDLYATDLPRFLRYNARDVLLVKRIDDEADVIKFRDVLRREIGVDFEDSYHNKDFCDMMCRRKLKELGKVGPTAPDYGEAPDSDFEGGFVFDAYEGVTNNVVGVDLASLYPYTMAMLNASPETKVDETHENAVQAANGQHFTLDEDGLFTQLVDWAISLKAEYKEKRDAAETDAEYDKWQQKYQSAKTITNSIYGITGWERFFLYDEAVAEAITLTGQAVIQRTAEHVETAGYEVIYGDTDSCYVEFPDDWSPEECLSAARQMCTELNEEVYPEFAESFGLPPEDNLWEIEVEAHMKSFFQAGKKKRYAYIATWKDGRWIDDPKPSITGFSSRRSDSAELTEETEEAVLEAILDHSVGDVSEIVYQAAREIEPVEPNWERIGIPGGLKQQIDPARAGTDGYYAFSGEGYPQGAHPRAAWNANKLLDTDFGQGDKPMRVYLRERVAEDLERQIDVIAFDRASDLEPVADAIRVDVDRMVDTLLVSPLEKICDAVDVDIEAAVRGQTQSGLGEFV